MPRVRTGPKGGKYVIKGGRKQYVSGSARSSRAPRASGLKGLGAYSRLRRGTRSKVIRGRGSYWTDFKGLVKEHVKPFETLGSKFGAPGAAIGKWLGSITGFGDYKVTKNSLMGMKTGGTSSGSVPRVQNIGGRVIVNHREYLRDIQSSADFNNLSYQVNPGLRASFPWLADIAACYQQWRPLGIIYCFESHSSDALNSTNTALGSLIVSSNYEADAPDFQNQQEALNTEYTTSTKPSQSVMHPIECSPAQNPQRIFYVRTGPLSPNASSDLWYDLCKTQFITLGSQADANVGKLYVSYEIEFLKPILNGAASGKTLQGAHYSLNLGSVAQNAPLSVLTTQVFDTIGLTIDVDAQTISFPQGNPSAVWQLDYYLRGTGGVTVRQYAATLTGDVAAYNLYEGATQSFVASSGLSSIIGPASTFVAKSSQAFREGPVGEGFVVQMPTTNSVLPTSLVAAEIFVTRLHPNLTPPPPVSSRSSHEDMDPYEKKLRDFLLDKKNRGLSDQAKLLLFDRLHPPSSFLEPEEEKKLLK